MGVFDLIYIYISRKYGDLMRFLRDYWTGYVANLIKRKITYLLLRGSLSSRDLYSHDVWIPQFGGFKSSFWDDALQLRRCMINVHIHIVDSTCYNVLSLIFLIDIYIVVYIHTYIYIHIYLLSNITCVYLPGLGSFSQRVHAVELPGNW